MILYLFQRRTNNTRDSTHTDPNWFTNNPTPTNPNTHLKKHKPATEWSCAPSHLLRQYCRTCRHDRFGGRGTYRHKPRRGNGLSVKVSKPPTFKSGWHEQPMRADQDFWATGHHSGPTEAPCEGATPNGRTVPSLHTIW